MAFDEDMFGTPVQTTTVALLSEVLFWTPSFITFMFSLFVHELIVATHTMNDMVIVTLYIGLRTLVTSGLLWLVARGVNWLQFYFNYQELRRIAQGYWASRLRGVPFQAPEKYWIHGSTKQIRLRVCFISTASMIGLLSPWRSLSVMGGIELGFLAHNWLLELLCGRYQWKPRGIMTSTQPYQEAAWHFFFRESWVTRQCFSTSFGGDGYFAELLARQRMWWLGYLIVVSFAGLCGAVSFVASILV